MSAHAEEKVRFKLLLICVVVGLGIWLIPTPAGVSAQGWRLLAIFIATVVGCVVGAATMGVMALLAMSLAALTQTLDAKFVFATFGEPIVWLVVSAFLLSRGFIKTGLGKRFAYIFISLFGKSSLGLAYALFFSEAVLAPAIPSNTARGGGVVFPIVHSIAVGYGSKPEDGTAGKIGAFLMFCSYNSNLLTSALFLTGMAPTPLAMSLAKAQGVDVSWGAWFIAAIVPIGILAVITPLLIYVAIPPEMKSTPKAPALAKEQLAALGPMSREEKLLLLSFAVILVLWIFGTTLHVDNTVAAVTGLCILLLGGVLTFDDIKSEKGAWDVLLWLAPLLMMTEGLSHLGVIKWFSDIVQRDLGGISWFWGLFFLVLVYFYSHYLFTSNTSHVNAMFAPFLAVALGLGAPPVTSAILLSITHCLFAITTHYGTGTAPVYFGADYVKQSTWWIVGLGLSVVYLLVLFTVGMAWWHFIGLN